MTLISDQVDQKEVDIITRELKKVIEKNIDGDVVEFGCYVGTTSVFIADLLKTETKKFYVYDSFAGLPEKTHYDSSPLGESFKTGELLASKKEFIKNINQAHVPMPIIKKGWFSDLKQNDLPNKVAFAFLDGDYYESIRDSLNLLDHCLSLGATLVIDDYVNASLPGASKAVDNWLIGKNATKKIEHSLAIIYT